jgi:hypothetical protein
MIEIQVLALEMAVGAALTTGGDGAGDESGVPLREDFETQSEFVQLAWSAVLDQDVGFIGEGQKQGSVGLDFEIENL